MAKKKASPEEISARICNDVRVLVNAHLCDGLDVETTKHALQHVLRLWGISNARNRYRDCKNWSKAALAKFKEDGTTSGLICDHVVPIKLFLDSLIKGSFSKIDWTNEELEKLLDKYLVTAVVTKEENRLFKGSLQQCMPNGEKLEDLTSPKQIWSRYGFAGIKMASAREVAALQSR